MKTDTLKKWVRRSVILALGACIVVGVTSCDDDDLDIPQIYQWDIDWTNDTSGVNPLTIPLEWGDLNEITNYMETFGDYTVSVTVNGAQVTVEIWDWTNATPFSFFATGTITSPTTANGNYTGTDANNDAIQGTWTVIRQ